MKKNYTYIPTLLTKLLRIQCIASFSESNLLHKEKIYERNPSYKIYNRLDKMKNILNAVKGVVLSGVQLINYENFYVNMDKRGFFIKLSLTIRKDVGNGTSGVLQLRFIMWILIDLHLVTLGRE